MATIASTASTQGAREVIAVRGGFRRWIAPWYSAYGILGLGASGIASISIPLIVAGRGGSATQIGSVIALQNLGALFAPLWGSMADRTKAYRLLFFSGFGCVGLAFLGFGVLNAYGAWLACAFLLGLGTGASNTIACLFIVEFSPKGEWAPRISWLQTFNAVGSVLGMAIAGWIAPRAGALVAAFFVIPAIALGSYGLPVRAARHEPRHEVSGLEVAQLTRRAGPNAAATVTHLHRLRLTELTTLLHTIRSRFGLFLTSWFLFSLAVSAFGALYPLLMLKSFKMDVAHSSLLVSIATAVSIPLYNMVGRLTTRFGPLTLLGVGVAARMLSLLGLACLASVHTTTPLLIAIVLFSAYQGIWPLLSVASNDLAAELAPCGEGAAMGLFSAIGAAASALGALAGGKIADTWGYPAVSAFAAAGTFLSFACVAALWRARAPQTIAKA